MTKQPSPNSMTFGMDLADVDEDGVVGFIKVDHPDPVMPRRRRGTSVTRNIAIVKQELLEPESLTAEEREAAAKLLVEMFPWLRGIVGDLRVKMASYKSQSETSLRAGQLNHAKEELDRADAIQEAIDIVFKHVAMPNPNDPNFKAGG